jgi:hypothetical protein
MRNVQAWGWLAAGVVALGLNGIYHDQGAELAHQVAEQVAERVSERSAALVERISGQADQILADARAEVGAGVRLVAAHDEVASCRVSEALARAQAKMARTQGEFAHFEAMSARQEAELAALDGDQIKVDQEEIEQQVEAQIARVHIASFSVDPVIDPVKIRVVCPRVRVNVPALRIPPVHVRAVTIPHVHVPRLRFPELAISDSESNSGPI